jgi:hypothetical protein
VGVVGLGCVVRKSGVIVQIERARVQQQTLGLPIIRLLVHGCAAKPNEPLERSAPFSDADAGMNCPAITAIDEVPQHFQRLEVRVVKVATNRRRRYIGMSIRRQMAVRMEPCLRTQPHFTRRRLVRVI